jgi:4'-phosphopantetheinyl transferase
MAYTSNWNLPPGKVELLTEDVHAWSASLDVQEEEMQSLLRILDFEERARADRFYFERDRSRFIACRAYLRTILAYYLDIEPERLQFNYTPNGKPYLVQRFRGSELQFNLSHSRAFALYAVTLNRQVGVDIEHIYLSAEIDSLADRILTKREKAAWSKLSANERLKALFRYWTCKEAVVKATGKGLAMPLEKIHISLKPDQTRLMSINQSVREASQWSLQELHPVPDFAAAIVVEGFRYHLNHWQWPQ